MSTAMRRTAPARLREAYVAADPADRLAAMRALVGRWRAPTTARQVLTAYAAARMPVDKDLAERRRRR